MNLPNFLTCLRIALAVLLILLLSQAGFLFKSLALVFFIVAMLTDYWDGKIARARGLVSNFGKLMDPIADKVLTLSAFVAFVQISIVPAWMVVIIMARDFLITGFRLVMPPGAHVEAARSGKHKTVLQFAAIIGILLFLAIRETSVWDPRWTETAFFFIHAGMLLIVIVTLWSGVRYAAKNWHVFENS